MPESSVTRPLAIPRRLLTMLHLVVCYRWPTSRREDWVDRQSPEMYLACRHRGLDVPSMLAQMGLKPASWGQSFSRPTSAVHRYIPAIVLSTATRKFKSTS